MLSQVVCSKNNLFFAFLLAGYLFGVILYDVLGFAYTDELMTAFLLLFAVTVTIVRGKEGRSRLRPLMVLSGIFTFYLAYSLLIHSNVPKAIFKDLVIQLKPFLGFYCTCLIAPRLSAGQKQATAILCLLVGAVILIIGLTGNIYPFFGHPSRYATAAVCTAFLFFYCSSYTWTDIALFLILLSVGLLSTRSKFYGLLGGVFFLVCYCKLATRIRFNWRTVLAILLVLLICAWLAREKIILYYVDGMMNSREMWSRPAMLLTSGRILCDYFPFGSGLASFGTFASGEYYSPIYAEYGIDRLWGISRETRFFICDAFYPSLAQFGAAGVCLYLFFWTDIMRRAYRRLEGNRRLWLLPTFACLFFLIEGIADTTFTHNRGLFVLIVTALALNELEGKR